MLDLGEDNSTVTGVDHAATFTENGLAVAIADSDTSITDVDDSNIESATIVLTNAKDGDVLDTGNLPNGITASTNISNGKMTVTLKGTATLADYQTAIHAVTFHNTSEKPDTSDRTIQVTVNDGEADSSIATSTIHVTAVNDAPTAHDDTIIIPKNSSGVQIGSALLANDADVDDEQSSLSIAHIKGSDGEYHEISYGDIDVEHGTVHVSSLGNISFIPDDGFVGETSFEYQTKDPDDALSNEATATFYIDTNETIDLSKITGAKHIIVTDPDAHITGTNGDDALTLKATPSPGEDQLHPAIDFGSGTDTFIISPETLGKIDLSHVKNVEKIEVSNGTNAALEKFVDEFFSQETNRVEIDWTQAAKDAVARGEGVPPKVKLDKSEFVDQDGDGDPDVTHIPADNTHPAYDQYNIDTIAADGSHHIHQVLIDHQIHIDWQ